jgi:ATP sulfurylase
VLVLNFEDVANLNDVAHISQHGIHIKEVVMNGYASQLGNKKYLQNVLCETSRKTEMKMGGDVEMYLHKIVIVNSMTLKHEIVGKCGLD